MKYQRIDIKNLSELMNDTGRADGQVYFVRLCGTDADTEGVIDAYYAAARTRGVIIDGQIQNPDERQISYFNEVLGAGFENSAVFIEGQLGKWLPAMSGELRAKIAEGLNSELTRMAQSGKTESILKNVYTKIMCWLYYRFARLFAAGMDDGIVRVLYRTDGVTAHEMILLKLLNGIGIDILMLEPDGDDVYLSRDPKSEFSQKWETKERFPANFSVKQLGTRFEANQARQTAHPIKAATAGANAQTGTSGGRNMHTQGGERGTESTRIDISSRFPQPRRTMCTNAWMKHPEIKEILTPPINRGNDSRFFYNALIRMSGAQDRITYKNEIVRFYERLKMTGRRTVVINERLDVPTPEEIAPIRRHNYRSAEEAIVDLAVNLPVFKDKELQDEVRYAYAKILKEETRRESNVNRFTVICVYLLCYIARYREALFANYHTGDVACVIYNGGCVDENEVMFFRFLSMLPVDVLILAPNLNRGCLLKDERLLDIRNQESVPVFTLSPDMNSVSVMTAAAHAQRDLDRELYTDTGLYRERQFAVANATTLKTTYDELYILWDQELKYRPGFMTTDEGSVRIPVLYAKVSGVEKGNTDIYWQKIRQLLTEETMLYRSLPMDASTGQFQQLAVNVLKNGKIRRKELMNDRKYPLGILRTQMQEHMLDKVQYMLDKRVIRGTFENGMEYTVLATILGLKKEWLRLIQNFDFTKKNPKVVCVCADEKPTTPYDAILLTFMNLIGFDVVMFVPTGYVTIEKYLNTDGPVEHQMGPYIYDLNVPDIAALPEKKGISWLNNLFKRGV